MAPIKVARYWSFETSWPHKPDEWIRTNRRFTTSEEAADAAMRWLAICAENSALVAVRLSEEVEAP